MKITVIMHNNNDNNDNNNNDNDGDSDNNSNTKARPAWALPELFENVPGSNNII